MARLARVVVPGVPHHVTQRGARKMRVFFSEVDYRRYLAISKRQFRKYGLETWAYCLMPNHVHLIVVPASACGLARPIGETHRRYAIYVNGREGWNGHLWQERFASFPMDEAHLERAVRYVLLNPVRAGLVEHACDWPYSSAAAHALGARDPLVTTGPMADRVPNWSAYLEDCVPRDELKELRSHSSTGRPLGSDAFVKRVERLLSRRLKPRRPGPAPRGS